MKMTKYIPITIATLAIAAGNTALAGETIPSGNYYSASPTTFQLMSTSQTEPSYSQIENGERYTDRIVNRKISNLQILKLLKSDGVINTVDGWSIVLVASYEDGPIGFFIRKAGRSPIDISNYIQMLSGEEEELDTGYTTGTSDYTEGGYSEDKTLNFLEQMFIRVGQGEESIALIIGGARLSYTYTSSNNFGRSAPDAPQSYPGPSSSSYTIKSYSLPSVTGIFGYIYSSYGDLISGRVTGTEGSKINIDIIQDN